MPKVALVTLETFLKPFQPSLRVLEVLLVNNSESETIFTLLIQLLDNFFFKYLLADQVSISFVARCFFNDALCMINKK